MSVWQETLIVNTMKYVQIPTAHIIAKEHRVFQLKCKLTLKIEYSSMHVMVIFY